MTTPDPTDSWVLPPEPGPSVTRLHAPKSGGYYVRDEVFPDMWRPEGGHRREWFGVVLAQNGVLTDATRRPEVTP